MGIAPIECKQCRHSFFALVIKQNNFMKKATKAAPKAAAKSAKKAAPKKAPQKTSSNSSSDDLQKIFEDELKDIYWAEKHLSKALPKLQKAASAPALKDAFANHLEETKGHIARLEQVFEIMGKKAQAKKCEAMEGLVKEGASAIEEYDMGAGRDVALIISAQKVEHYEIAAYGSLKAVGAVLGLDDCVELFEETFKEETACDETLSAIAADVNLAANEV
jgi:ferritin-like metal-binding protein YciE